MNKTLEQLQLELDEQKYYASIAAGIDQCGLFTYCKFCKHEALYPCAKAYDLENFKIEKNPTEIKVTEEKVAEKKPVEKKAPAKKPAAKKPIAK